MKAIDFAVSRLLPPDLRQPHYDLSKKGVAVIMAQVASSYPDKFAEVAKGLGDLGRAAAWKQGYTITPEDTKPVIDTGKFYQQMDAELAALKKQDLTPAEFDDARSDIHMKYSDLIEKATMGAAVAKGNAWAKAVVSGARGNAAHVKAILSTPGVYTDNKGAPVPLFVRHSFAEGVRPAEMLAGTYGARLAVTGAKKAVAAGGDLGKLLSQSASHYNVTEHDCGIRNGIDLPPDDPSLSGRVLARPVGDLPAGTVIDRAALAKIRKLDKPVIVRSALTCKSAHGLCAKCVGLGPDGKFPRVGESIGITAGQSVSEPIVQGSLNTKHNCLSINDSELLLAGGELRNIAAIAVGDRVIGYGGDGLRTVQTVTALVDQGRQPVYRYSFILPRGRKPKFDICSTREHQVLTCAGKREIGHTDHILLPRAIRSEGGIHEPLAFLAGFFMGDGIRQGGTAAPQSVKVSCAEPSTASELDSYLHNHGMSLKKRKRSHDWAVVMDTFESPRCPRTGRIVKGAQHPVKDLIARLGWAGCYAHEKTIPDEVWTWDDESVRAFVSGFLTTDGSVYTAATGMRGVSFSSSSRDMITRLEQLLWSRLGVFCSRPTCINKCGNGARHHDQWQITVQQPQELAILAAQLSPIGPRREKLQGHRDNLPPPDFYAPVVAKLLSTTFMGELPCMDISVDADNELFSLSNGAVVKNSGMAKGKKAFSGFAYTSQFVQVPDDFKDKAAVAELPGEVEKVEEAPQGGTFIHVAGQRHFALPGMAVLVKPGDKVEAGDALSDGLVNPRDIVRLRGLGEGRRYYADRLGQILTDSGNPPDRRHMECIAKSAVDNYIIHDPDADSEFLPDDLVRENDFLQRYTPPADTTPVAVDKAHGHYLQQPVLHYTVGTQITPRMVERMKAAGADKVLASREEPWFKPEMRRLRVASHDSKDWLVSLGTSYLGTQMRKSLERADDTDVQSNWHFGPRLAFGGDAGAGGFGENIEQTGKF